MSKICRDDNDWVGYKQNELIVVKKIGEKTRGGHTIDYLLTLCSCGKEYKIYADTLIYKNTKSCRNCSQVRKNNVGLIIQGQKCIKEIFSRYENGKSNGRSKKSVELECLLCNRRKIIKADTFRYGQCACKFCYSGNAIFFKPTDINKYYVSIKSSAKSRKLNFELTKDNLLDILNKQNNKCALSGVDISFKDGTASLDRINSSLHYTIENCQFVHRSVNFMKTNIPQGDFLDFCKKITYNMDL